MKARTLERLALIAAEAEARLREEIARHNAALGQIAYQRGVLADYRARLAASWRHGGVVNAAEALRAARFVAASEAAEAQVNAEERRARHLLAEALQNLARLEQRRKGLVAAQGALRAREAAAAAQALEREIVWRRRPASA